MATIIRSLNGKPAQCRPIKVTLPLELIEFVTSNYPHMADGAAIRAFLMDEYSAYIRSSKQEEAR